jgi:hypothetical protein
MLDGWGTRSRWRAVGGNSGARRPGSQRDWTRWRISVRELYHLILEITLICIETDVGTFMDAQNIVEDSLSLIQETFADQTFA